MAGEITVFLGAEGIASPLGITARENFENALAGKSALQWLNKPFSQVPRIYAGQWSASEGSARSAIQEMAAAAFQDSFQEFDLASTQEDRWMLILCTTKGEIDFLQDGDWEKAHPSHLLPFLQALFPFPISGKVISNACISGLSGIIYAADQISTGLVDHAWVIGVDGLSEFTTLGFESFFALENGPCKPFDQNRKGLNLGEGAGSVVLSRTAMHFKQKPFCYLAGSTSNDANHISGPSRTGEGLVRSISKTLKLAGKKPEDIGFIAAHGTGTSFNDDMESIAFQRLGLSETPLNGLKGYFGHTLGASGILELGMTMQSMRANRFLATLGCEVPGTVAPVRVLTQPISLEAKVSLKTASGFGGCNASVLIGKTA